MLGPPFVIIGVRGFGFVGFGLPGVTGGRIRLPIPRPKSNLSIGFTLLTLLSCARHGRNCWYPRHVVVYYLWGKG
jgi:hypothetical protein